MLAASLWVLWALIVLAAAGSLRAGYRHLRAVREGIEGRDEWLPPATLIVPVKGLEEGLTENLRALAVQDYPDYELLIVVRGAEDPAVAAVRPLLGDRARLVVAGEGDPHTGEKINNLLAAVAAARPASEVFAFADSDGRVEAGWLGALVSPLADRRAGAVTGYRWYFPESGRFWSLLRCVWNSTVGGNFGARAPYFAWGGAMAVRRDTFEAACVADFWRGAVSDDYRLTDAVRAAGLEVRFAPRAMVATTGECSAREFFSWTLRQIIISRVYHPRLWWIGFLGHALYCCAMTVAAALAAAGDPGGVLLFLLATLPGAWYGRLRRQAAELMFPGRAAWFRRHGWACSWLTVPATWAWLAIFLASRRTRRIRWRGNTYELLGPSATRAVTS